ncbi:glycosyltransferase family 2 protein [Microbacterium sp.]|uniref:glycosyltransferase family 2 protein n=1 Tax=Microbacterium sp. TaxID=51671 RepID=UPI003F6F7809
MRPLHLTVAVLTFHRADQLVEGLTPIIDQVRGLAAAGGAVSAGRVLVVDNDPAASARSVVTSLGAPDVDYVVEPAPGIAAARGRALREADASDLLIFIDDDERPRPGWLATLVETWLRHESAAVAGRVVPVFSEPVPPWIEAGRFFVRRSMPTGTEVSAAAAGNLLLDVAQLRSLGVEFDGRLGLGGGEDTLLTRTLVARGGRIVWCDESVAEDHVPASRMTRAWVLRRAWSHGNTSVVVDLILGASRAQRARVRISAAVGGCARVVAGGVQALIGAVTRSRYHSARGLRAVYRGAGMAVASIGVTYHEYSRPAASASATAPAGGSDDTED